jgi:hypothetical protein
LFAPLPPAQRAGGDAAGLIDNFVKRNREFFVFVGTRSSRGQYRVASKTGTKAVVFAEELAYDSVIR